jgi:hypothetical protein
MVLATLLKNEKVHPHILRNIENIFRARNQQFETSNHMFISLQIYKSAWGFASMALVVGGMQYPARVMPLRCLKQAAKQKHTNLP